MLDNVEISRPNVNSVIPNGKGYIEGNFTLESAQELAMQIESGALPLELKVLEQQSISSTPVSYTHLSCWHYRGRCVFLVCH